MAQVYANLTHVFGAANDRPNSFWSLPFYLANTRYVRDPFLQLNWTSPAGDPSLKFGGRLASKHWLDRFRPCELLGSLRAFVTSVNSVGVPMVVVSDCSSFTHRGLFSWTIHGRMVDDLS